MVPIVMLIFVIVLMLLFIILAFLQKSKDPSVEEPILSKEDVRKIKKESNNH